ncbi:MAG: DUF1599 domain-containing protein [Saprospiraceae bacterium]|nr:DUF1599 domain-containing protein [Saprospiraceae bacterium]
MENTLKQYDEVIKYCKDIFMTKMKDYGSAWRILRTSSLTDQIFIKAQRIKSIERKGVQKVEDGIKSEYIGIINYSIMALIQLELGVAENPEMKSEVAEKLYDKYFLQAKSLMENKNHDYGEAWRDMRVTSITDIILMKLFRTKQIEDNNGKTFISEGVDANYNDIINYSVFALIMLND